MFRLHKNRSNSDKSRERIDFKFSNFQALHVPKGWDKLFVSLISTETGKTIAKLGKASIRNGSCRWTESVSESICLPQGDGDSGELDECLIKFVVAMGTLRSGLLGETEINLSDYMSSKVATPLSLPLKKCNNGTVLQLKIQCMTPKTKHRDKVQGKQANLQVDPNVDNDDAETKSDVSDSAFSRSVGSSSSNHMEITSQVEEHSQDLSLSASGSRHSFDSLDGFSGKDISSPNNLIGRQDSAGSHNSTPDNTFGDANRSNLPSFNSRAQDPMSRRQNRKENLERNSSTFLSSPLSLTDSSKDLLEAAEVTIEELRAEARMWERNARKLMLDMDALQKELSEQSKNQATLTMELSASRSECDSLRQEIEQVKNLLEEMETKQKTTEDLNFQSNATEKVQKELEEEVRSYKESNASLTDQLQKTQQSNIELLSILQELEGIVEAQKREIEELSSQKSKLEEQHSEVVSQGEETLTTDLLEPNGSLHQRLQGTQDELESSTQVLENAVKDENNEIKMEQDFTTQTLLDCESKWHQKLAEKEEEILKLEAKLSEAIKDQGNQEIDVEHASDNSLVEVLKAKIEELERDCNELTEENLELLLQLKESRKDTLSADALIDSSSDVSEVKVQIDELKQELKQKEAQIEEAQVQCADLKNRCSDLEIQLHTFRHRTLDLEDELQKCHGQMEEKQIKVDTLQQQIKQHEGKEIKTEDLQVSALRFQSHSPVNLSRIFVQLPELIHHSIEMGKRLRYFLNLPVDSESISCFHDLELRCTKSPDEDQVDVILDCIVLLNRYFERECSGLGDDKQECDDFPRDANRRSNQLDDSDTNLEMKYAQWSRELEAKKSEIESMKSSHLQKEEENEVQRRQLAELESQIDALRVESEKCDSSKCLENLKNEITIQNGSEESCTEANKILEWKLSELQRGKHDLEDELSELEEENMHLSERISAMEAQLRYLTNEKELCDLELRHVKSQAMNLHEEIRRLENNMESQKIDMKQKVEDMQKRWLEAQEECAYLKKANQKLQATTESLIEECALLQKINRELRRQNIDLHSHCTIMESRLKDSERRFSECLLKFDTLEEEFSSILEEVSLKEKSLNSELDALIREDKEHKEKLIEEGISLNQKYSQKAFEVDNLQRELVHLIDQISATYDEQEALASEAIAEASALRADKARLEVTIQDLQEKLMLCNSQLSKSEAESEAKLKELMDELTVSRQNREVLMVDYEKQLVLLGSLKHSEERYRNVVNGLEMKLKTAEYERLQLEEDISCLKEQLQKAMLFHDGVLILNNSLNEAKFENEKLTASLELLSGQHKQMELEKDSLVQKISSMEKAILELDECRRSKVALEEKILRLEGDLSAKEAQCARDAKLKFELNKVKRANNECQIRIRHLNEDKDKYFRRALILEGKDRVHPGIRASDFCDESIASTASVHDEKQLSLNSEDENTEYMSKIQSLQNELAEALEANDMYKAQLRRFLSEEQNSNSDVPRISALEMELKDLREQYFQMSLKYAEVEAQREELVLKLKPTNSKWSWFS